MRLTLRTLLAYLDDILEPADARELGQKIEESEFASGLVHRIRSVTRKLRLGAPKLAGKGMGLDANTVAEYLDNTLPQDRVPDFEKVCLESDVHLAEVASCHQILTLVLGEPADVDPALRERIRALQMRVEGVGSEALDEPLERHPVAAPTPPPKEHEVEDWEENPSIPLITPAAAGMAAGGSSVRLLPVVGTMVAVFLLALFALIAMGPLDNDHPVLGRFLADASREQEGSASPNDDVPSHNDSAPQAPSPDGQTSPSMTLDDTPGQGDAATEPTEPTEPQRDVEGDAAGGDEPAAEVPSATFPLPPGTEDPAPTTPPPAGDATVPAVTIPPLAPADGAEPAGVMTEGGVTIPEGDAEGEVKEPEPLARSTSDLHVLARFDPAAGTWHRLAPGEPLEVGQQLIALPTYRPQIALSNGIQLTLIGPTAVSFLAPDAEGTVGIAVQFGRLLAVGGGEPGGALNIEIGDRASRVVFQDLDSTLALEVQRYLEPGVNPTEEAAHRLAGAQAVAGRLMWEEAAPSGGNLLEAGQMVAIVDSQPLQVTEASPPAWLDPNNLRPIDRDASRQLQPLLAQDRPLSTCLSEQVSNRLVEVRALAIRSLSLLDIYDPFVNAFNSKELRTFWPGLIEALQISVARGPDDAARVRSTFERLRGDVGSQLFRLLWGYSAEQLAAGEGEALVALLSNASMDVRVLAFENLSRIAGKTNSYHPELDPGRQKRAILNWERDAKESGITYKNPPLDLSP